MNVIENDIKFHIIVSFETGTNMRRYLYMLGKDEGAADNIIRQFLEDYLQETLTAADQKAIDKIIKAERKAKFEEIKEEEKATRPSWDWRKIEGKEL
jgi:hypothetical protein